MLESEAYEKAVDFFARGRKEEAAKMFESIIERNPGFADAYESLGMVHYKMGNLDEAIRWTEKLAELKPDHAMAHTNLSVFYMKKGDKERAEIEKAKAVVLNFSKPKK
jgi:tetratricopeptide (TPR) repeat protein